MADEATARVEEWDEVHKVVPWGSVPDRNFEKFVTSRYGPAMRSLVRFLDLGCGAGAQAIWLAEEGYRVTALDGAQAAIRRLSERIERSAKAAEISGRLKIDCVDLSTLLAGTFANETFDCSFDMCCLQHMSENDAVAVVQKARRWLKPGGIFWSKQAIAPFDMALNRVSYIRLASMESIRRMFRGYADVKMDMLREVVRGDKDLWSVIVQAKAGI